MTVDISAVHVVVHLQPGWQHAAVNGRIVEDGFRKAGFVVFKTNRPSAKVGGVAIKGTHSEAIHLNVRPVDGDIFGAKWPEVVFVTVPPGRLTPKEVTVGLEYVMEAHPDLEGKICLRRCHRYFAPLESDPHRKVCECRVRMMAEDERRAQLRERSRRPRVSAEQAIEEAFGPKKPKAEIPCAAFLAGRCRKTKAGATCGFLHPVTPVPGEVACKLPRNKKGVCENGESCEYRHTGGETSTAGGNGCARPQHFPT